MHGRSLGSKEVAYRKSAALIGSFGAIAAWVTSGELEAREIDGSI